MTFEELSRANETISTMGITKTDKKTGKTTTKQYAEVNQRIKAFRMLIPDGSIVTELVSLTDGVAIFRATVSDGEGHILGTGTAYEKENSSFINQTSFIENCETSAVGRALAMCGIGIDLSIASYEEVANAQKNQDTEKAQEILSATREEMIKVVLAHYPEGTDNLDKLLKCWHIDKVEDAKDEQLMAVYHKYEGK